MTPIIDLLAEEVKTKLKEQTEHLEKMSVINDYEEGVYMDKFKAMYKGAETLMYILHETEFGKSGIYNFLQHLDRDQLKVAISSAEEILREKESAGKVTLYYVDNSELGIKYFHKRDLAEEHYKLSVESSLKSRWPQINLAPAVVYVEELEDFLDKELAEQVRSSL